MGFAVTSLTLIQMSQYAIKERAARSLSFVAISRTYAVIWGFVDITYWKSFWDLVNCCFGTSALHGACTLAIGLVSLELLAATRNAVSVPCQIVLDVQANACTSLTYLNTQVPSIGTI